MVGLKIRNGVLTASDKIDFSESFDRAWYGKVGLSDSYLNTHSLMDGTFTWQIGAIPMSQSIERGPAHYDLNSVKVEIRQVTVDEGYIYIFDKENVLEFDRKSFSFIRKYTPDKEIKPVME